MARIGIGKLSGLTGVKVETIRYFEKVGLIEAPGRSEGGHRLYDERHVRTLTFIKQARELGFAQSEVREILGLGGPTRACCDEVREIAVHHLDQVRRKIADLGEIERLLASTIEQCSGGHVPDCPVIEMIEQTAGS